MWAYENTNDLATPRGMPFGCSCVSEEASYTPQIVTRPDEDTYKGATRPEYENKMDCGGGRHACTALALWEQQRAGV